jgi:assimilatory nitrate reductase catalytic subunit
LSYAKLEQAPQQWPYPEGAAQGRARLYEDGLYHTPDSKARFITNAYQPVAEPRDARYPFALNTGRLRDQWHGMSRTGTVAKLFGHTAEPALQMHAQDMQRLKLADGDLVHLTSRRGSQIIAVEASEALALSQAFLPMHWGEEFLGGRKSHGVNGVTQPAHCAQSKQPELKHSAVKILPAELPWRITALALVPAQEALTRINALRELMPQFDHAVCVPFEAPVKGADNTLQNTDTLTGIMLIASNYVRSSDESIASIEEILQLNDPAVMRYADHKRGTRRVMRLQGGMLTGFLLAGDVSAQAWLKPLLKQGASAAAFGRYLMMPSRTLPAQLTQQLGTSSKQLCSCFAVSEQAVRDALKRMNADESPDAQLATVQAQLKCGTNCGSCVPEIKRLIRLQTQVALA